MRNRAGFLIFDNGFDERRLWTAIEECGKERRRYAGEFDSLKRETIVLCESAGQAFADSGFKTIDVTLEEKNLISSILHLHEN